MQSKVLLGAGLKKLVNLKSLDVCEQSLLGCMFLILPVQLCLMFLHYVDFCLRLNTNRLNK